MNDTPQITDAAFRQTDHSQLFPKNRPDHPPRVLLLYGSLRKRSFSRLMSQEAAQVLTRLGATTKIFNPAGLPLPDDCDDSHEKVQELRELMTWSEAMVFTGTARGDNRRHEDANRLHSTGTWRGRADLGQNPGIDAGVRWVAEL